MIPLKINVAVSDLLIAADKSKGRNVGIDKIVTNIYYTLADGKKNYFFLMRYILVQLIHFIMMTLF